MQNEYNFVSLYMDLENYADDMIFIRANTSSSKNGRVFSIEHKKSFDSKQTREYKLASKQDYVDFEHVFKEMVKNCSKPYFVGFHFVRKSRHKYDFINPCQTVQDLMTRYGWIEDDNTTIMYPVPFKIDGRYETYSKENPGVYITIMNGKTLTFDK